MYNILFSKLIDHFTLAPTASAPTIFSAPTRQRAEYSKPSPRQILVSHSEPATRFTQAMAYVLSFLLAVHMNVLFDVHLFDRVASVYM